MEEEVWKWSHCKATDIKAWGVNWFEFELLSWVSSSLTQFAFVRFGSARFALGRFGSVQSGAIPFGSVRCGWDWAWFCSAF